MRILRLLPFVAFLLPSVLFAQVQSNAATAATQDPQAVSVFNQALSAAGGSQALKAVADYTGSGNITYHGHSDVQGTVSIKGLGSIAIRLDATLPTGVRSWAIHDGVAAQRNEDGTLSVAATNRKVPTSDAFPHQTPLFPSSIAFPNRQLTNVLADRNFGISYKGVTRVDGHSVLHIQVQRSASRPDPMSQYHTREFFIDTTTFQIVMTQDLVPKNTVHQIHYSNYQAVSGVLVPFAITEELGGTSTWTVQLSQMTFNSGLQDSAFVLQ